MIEVKNLVKVYGSNKAVDNLNFKVEKGQILGFLGPNGAGKSTTMNMITGYISATEGTALIADYDILKEPEKAKSHIGYLPEQPPLYTDMTVKEYLTFVAKVKGVKKKDILVEIEYAMDATKITDMRDRLISNLSKGYKQRVGLAATLLGNPEVLILDEPTVGLDPKQMIEIRELIKKLAKNHTVILSSHILQEISAVCDRVIIINKGKMVLDQMLEDLNKNIADAQCLVLTLKTDEDNAKRMFADKDYIREVTVIKSNEEDCVDVRIFANDGRDIREDVYKLVADTKVSILQMYMEKKSLEDIFLEVTNDVEDDVDYGENDILTSDETEGRVQLVEEETSSEEDESMEDQTDKEDE